MPYAGDQWMIRKHERFGDEPFDSVPASIIGPATEPVEVCPVSVVEELEAEVQRLRDLYEEAFSLGHTAGFGQADDLESEVASEREVVEELRASAREFLDAYVDSERSIPADDLERLDEAEIALRKVLFKCDPPLPASSSSVAGSGGTDGS